MDRTEKSYQVIWPYHSEFALQSVYEYISIDSELHAYRVINEIQDLGNSLFTNPYKFQECI